MSQNPIDEVTSSVADMDLDGDDSTSMRDDSASTLPPTGGETSRQRRRARGRLRVERIFGDRMKGKRGDAAMLAVEDPEKQLSRAIERLPGTLSTAFKTGVSFHAAKPIEHCVAENLCRNLGLRGSLGADSARLFAFAGSLVSNANRIACYYHLATREESFHERRNFFFQALADRMSRTRLGGGVPPRRWDQNPITRQTCQAVLKAFVEARMAYLRMDVDGGEKSVQEGAFTKRTTQLIRGLDKWISFVQTIENKKQQEEDHELAGAMGDLGMGTRN